LKRTQGIHHQVTKVFTRIARINANGKTEQ